MEITEANRSTLVERVILMLVFSSLCVSIGVSLLEHLDGGRSLPEYIGVFLGGFVFVPISTLAASLIVFLFAFIGFGASGRGSLQRIWIATAYIMALLFCFALYYLLYNHEVWVIVLDHLRNKKISSLAAILITICAPAFCVYVSSFLLTEEWYRHGIESLNKPADQD